ncbi:MvdC/MvdD family ATP grasp protein [Gallaecimonas sp. GXIMD4217]|uniref:MvdC/MvdD family ATP grasp protein n=1 Tax=Gallaecimonas sp. GXIMD4217 TaxID=3131927 RepID=UPI00311B0D42
MPKKILIITNSCDLHADLMEPLLKARGQLPFRVNLDHFPKDYRIVQSVHAGHCGGYLEHIPTKKRIALDEVGAVWMRKPADYAFLSDDLSPQEAAFARQETDQAMFGWLYALDCFWMSHPVKMRGAMWKGEQLKRAQGAGFRVPRSIVSNCPDTVRRFQAEVGSDIIFKSLSTPHLAADEVADKDRIADGLATTLVTEDMLDALDAVSELPCHFQEYVHKQHELRVTVIGDQVFAAKLHSQDDPRTRIDSRDMSAQIRYERTTLPPEIERRCRDFVAGYGLNYSALDLIVTPDDDYVFLENNPNGQFLYVEQLVPELGLMAALADTLVKEAQCRSQ